MARAACKLVSFYYSWLKPTLVLLSLKLANAFSLRGTATDFWGAMLRANVRFNCALFHKEKS